MSISQLPPLSSAFSQPHDDKNHAPTNSPFAHLVTQVYVLGSYGSCSVVLYKIKRRHLSNWRKIPFVGNSKRYKHSGLLKTKLKERGGREGIQLSSFWFDSATQIFANSTPGKESSIWKPRAMLDLDSKYVLSQHLLT